MKEARRHHYIPRFLLEGFSDSKTLWVIDKRNNKIYPATVNNVAVEKDFYRLNYNNNPLIIEDKLSKIESEVAPIVKEIVRTRKVPGGAKLEELVRFVAFQFCRTHLYRDFTRILLDKTIFEMSKWGLGEPDFITFFVNILNEFGTQKDTDDYYKFLSCMLHGVNDDFLIEKSVLIADEAVEEMMKLNWGLALAPEGSYFICSDNPVIHGGGHIENKWGEGDKKTLINETSVILCPLSKYVCLYGMMSEPEDAPLVYVESTINIANYNKLQDLSAHHYVYSPVEIPSIYIKGTLDYIIGLSLELELNDERMDFDFSLGE
jgi:hypothetical protein